MDRSHRPFASHRRRASALGVALFACVAAAGWRDPLAVKVGEGNKLFAAKHYDDALSKYADAQVHAPNSPLLFFNMAAAQYRKGQFDKATALLQKAAASPLADLLLRARANYNIGNCLVGEPGADLARLTRALERYRTALDLTVRANGEPIAKSRPLRSRSKFNAE